MAMNVQKFWLLSVGIQFATGQELNENSETQVFKSTGAETIDITGTKRYCIVPAPKLAMRRQVSLLEL